jgi:hypothetical protein
MVRAGRNRDQRAGAGPVLAAVDAQQRLALDHVDDLVSPVLVCRTPVIAGRDRHDRALRARGLLEHAE